MLTKREQRLVHELQLLTGVLTDDIQYLCFLLLKDGIFFKETKTPEEDELSTINDITADKVKSIQAITFEELLKRI